MRDFPGAKLCDELRAPAKLRSHLKAVHDLAEDILDGMIMVWPDLKIDVEAVLCGAAIHDLGKMKFPGEIDGPGRRHEDEGAAFLEGHGVPPRLARFASIHTGDKAVTLEEHVVALADASWSGGRDLDLEIRIAELLKSQGIQKWDAVQRLDEILGKARVSPVGS